MQANWSVYMIRCSDDSLYTGITTDVERRFQQHMTGKGAKYFRGRQPLSIIYQENELSKLDASRREIQIKKMTRPMKLRLIDDAGGKK